MKPEKYDFFVWLGFEINSEQWYLDRERALCLIENLCHAPIIVREKYQAFMMGKLFDDSFYNAIGDGLYDAPNHDLLDALYLEFRAEIENGIEQARPFEDYDHYKKSARSYHYHSEIV